MTKILFTIFPAFMTCFLYSQTNKFNDYNDTMLVVSCFQSDIIEKECLTTDFSTDFPDFYNNPVIIYQNFNENETATVQGDPLCLWVNKSVIDTINTLRWVRFKELHRKDKFVYFTFEVVDKREKKERVIASYEYKIKADKIGQGPKVYYRKIKIRKYLP